jgi:hypothetical protein
MSLSGMVEIPRLQAKYEFVMPALRRSQDKLRPASRLVFRFEHQLALK